MRSLFHHHSIRTSLIAMAILVFVLLFTVMIHAALGQNRIGADFYIFWRAGRALFVEHQNPYTSEVTLSIQQDILGRPATPLEDNLAFVYPLYSLFGMLPNIYLSYDWAISLWYTTNLIALFSFFYFLFPQDSKLASVSILLFFQILFGLIMGNFAIPVSLAILFFFGVLVLREKNSQPYQVAAGIFLAWATLKPQFVWCFCLLAILYALKQRWYVFLASFLMGIMALFIASFTMLPGWITSWITSLRSYAAYQQIAPSIIEILGPLMGMQAANFAGWVILLVLFALGIFLVIRWWREEIPLLEVLAWAGVFTFLIHPHGLSYEQIPSLIPLFLWVAKEGLRSPVTLFFWITTTIISWIPLFLPAQSNATDRSPILWMVVWFGWLLWRDYKQIRKPEMKFTV